MDTPAWMEEWRGVIDEALRAEWEQADWVAGDLREATEYMLFPGGKRLRPLLYLAAAEAVGAKDFKAIMSGALALEVFHTYTLIHDDLPAMDDDEQRRGKPSCHVQFDEPTAILTGDVLQGWAFGLLSRLSNTAMLREMAAVAGPGGVVDGQSLDLDLLERPVRERLEQMHLLKTARLMEAAVVMGIMSAGGLEEAQKAGRIYGRRVGLLFQLRDDLLDADDDEGANVTQFMSKAEVEDALGIHAQAAQAALQPFSDPAKLEGILDYLYDV